MCWGTPSPGMEAGVGTAFYLSQDSMHKHVCANVHVLLCVHLVGRMIGSQEEGFSGGQNGIFSN